MDPTQWTQRDLGVLWHPCTQMKDHESIPLIPIRKGTGIFLEDFEGNRYMDGISSWWVNIFGHCHPDINRAISDQLQQLEHVIFAGFSHEPGIALAERLVQLTPEGLNRVFYADNGSSAVEVALKMSYHHWYNQGQPQKHRFVSLSGAYHGETLSALSVSDIALYKATYKQLLTPSIQVPSPDCYHCEAGSNWQEHSEAMFTHMEDTLSHHAHETAAVIVEPLVQCAAGMRMYHPIYLERLRAACDKYQVHLIADEIAVGFGRTGTLFACEQANITPDFLCLSKALTGGYLPLSAVLTSEPIYRSFYHDYQDQKAFMHSHSYTGNPLACRAALATLDLFEKYKTLQTNQRLIQILQDIGQSWLNHPHVGDVRQTGMILAAEMVADKASKRAYPWQQRRGMRVYQHGLTQGALLRPLGNVVYLMPPYIITEEQLRALGEIALAGIDLATRD